MPTTKTNNPFKGKTKEGLETMHEEFLELGKSYDYVYVKVQRRNSKGALATLASFRVKPETLFELDEYVMKMSGGGSYRVTVSSPNHKSIPIITPFTMEIDGMPTPWPHAGTPTDQAGYSPRAASTTVALGTDAMIPPHLRGYPPHVQQHYMQQAAKMRPQTGALGPGATVPSDAFAIEQLGEQKAKNAKLEAEVKAMNDRYASDVSRLRDELMALRAESAKRESHAEIEALRAELRMMREAPKPEPAKPAFDLNAMAAIVGAMAPIVTAMVNSRSTAASESLRMQQEGMNNLMRATLEQGNKPDSMMELLTKLGPLLLPLVQDFMKQKDPEKQAALYEAMVSSNLNQTSMVAQLLFEFANAQAGEEGKWWVEPVKEILGGVVRATEGYAMSPGGLPGQPRLPGQPSAPQAPAGAAQPVQTGPTQGYEPVVLDGDAASNAQAHHLPQTVAWMFGMLPDHFKEEGWRNVLEALHLEPAIPVEKAAEVLSGRLEECMEADDLPAEYFEGFRENPGTVLGQLLSRLPISGSRPDWANQVIAYTIQMLVIDGWLDARHAPFELPPEYYASQKEAAAVVDTTGAPVSQELQDAENQVVAQTA